MELNECDNIEFQTSLFKIYWDENEIDFISRMINEFFEVKK